MALARDLSKPAVWIRSTPDASQATEPAEWAILATTPAALAPLQPYAEPNSPRPVRPWTDDYSSLLQIWR